jgi:patatin-like phospholipase/acyl hydrolase
VNAQVTSDTQRFQILSLDGGGIKGIFSAAVLAAIEEDLNTSVIRHFDLIAGTSTGGIIALGLGLGFTPRQLLDFYLEEGGTIFADRRRTGRLRQFTRAKFSASPLVDALKRRFGERKFGDSTKRLVIPAYNLGEDDVYIFRTPHQERLKRDYKVAAWKVALSTSAAPTYFPCAREVDKLRLIDGGVWANNPSMVAIVEAQGTLGIPLSSIRLLSLGTSEAIVNHRDALNFGGFWQWRSASIDIVLRGQTLAAINHSRFLLGEHNVLRINRVVPDGVLKLDGTTRGDALVAKAAHYSRREMPNIRHTFADHNAPEFRPLFTC